MGDPNLPQTTLWFIFQGNVAKDHVEQLRSPIAKLPDIEFHISSDPRDLHPRGNTPTLHGKPVVPGTIYERVLRDSLECQGAIAVVAPTGRDASEQGNLWLEIGLWLARRDMHLLKICHFGEISPISDINNLPYASYDNVDTLRALVSAHALHVRRFYHPSPTDQLERGYRRVHATFTPSADHKGAPWLSNESYLCHRDWNTTEACPFRTKALAFTAELLRMRQANYERATFQDSLSRIAHACRSLHHADSTGSSTQNITERDACARELRREVHLLVRFANQLLGDEQRSKAYSSAPLDLHQRFARFLEERLEVARQLEPALAEVEQNLPYPTLKAMAGTLLANLTQLADRSSDYRFNGVRANKSFADDLWRWADCCSSLAASLRLLGRVYYDECSTVLAQFLSNSNAPHFYQELDRAVQSLPHNQQNGRHMRIWRVPSPPGIHGE